ncbi:putative mRNA capping enzyme small subunit [Parapoxvirus red deer/HL953]|uniref:Putative mRNA capping enzyme small subunit n=1 Tax=Parapoxvirus red deer/HL953 TaxID=1579460 RepID=A0A0A7M9S3_9POXV|nr:putative mRNA capping enzyme small subunit [Parapoxvirus red deer/HL953]AIZ77325.1 putative mRNA capping enzyme small subunit [Parapoxvirus red deer/HL953]
MEVTESVRRSVREGLSVTLPAFESMPRLDLRLGVGHLPSLEYGTNYFLQLSRVNDLNRMPTDMLRLYTHDLMIDERDVEKVLEAHGIASSRGPGSRGAGVGKADAFVLDLSARNKFYRKERGAIRSNNYLTENNLYVADYHAVTFAVMRPLLELAHERFVVVKLPTLFGTDVVHALRVYCSLFGTVRLFKCVSDSWIKDSAVMVASEPRRAEIAKFVAHARERAKASVWKESLAVPFRVLADPVESEFVDRVLAFSSRVYEALYVTHSLLYESMTSESKSIENESQRKLKMLLQ